MSLCERDGVTPLYDNNNNGWVDLGILPPGAQRDVVLSILVPEDKNLAADAPFLFPITFFHADPPDCSATITFRIERAEGLDRLWDPLQMEVDAGEVVIPGSLLTYDLCFANASDTRNPRRRRHHVAESLPDTAHRSRRAVGPTRWTEFRFHEIPGGDTDCILSRPTCDRLDYRLSTERCSG